MRSGRRRALIVWLWFGLFVAVDIAFALLLLSRRANGAPIELFAVFDPGALVYLLVGALIVSRQPDNLIGLLLLASGTFSAVPWFALGSLAPADPAAIGALWVAQDLLADFAFVLLVFPNLYLLLLFPTGRTPGPRWRWLSLYGGLFILMIAVMILLNPELEIGEVTVPNPLSPFEGAQALSELPAIITTAIIMGLALFAVGCAAAPLVRYWRAGAVERTQIRWLFYAGALYMITFVLNSFVGFSGFLPLEVAWGLSGWAIPVAVAIAILRYRLFDIDVIIRRTLQYGVLTGLLVGLYFSSVLLLQAVLGSQAAWAESPLVVTITTLALAALFNPLRRRVQRFIDRRFYRRKVNAELALARFAVLARDEIDLEQVRAELFRVVGETLQPERMGLWLRPADGGERE